MKYGFATGLGTRLRRWSRSGPERGEESTDPHHRTWNILLVDDDPDFLYAAKRVLRHSARLRANVETAQEAEEALRIVDERLFDVVVADYRMSPEDGAELLRRIHEEKPDLKRVLLTGFDQDALAKNGVRSAEVDLVLDKNDLLADLDRKLTEFLERAAAENGH